MIGEPWIADDRKVVLPPREELHTSMESLIHHFKIVTEGYRVPEGEIYVTIESPRGELGCYVVSDGGPKPWRVKFRAPSFVALEATATCMHERLHRGHDRDRRLARLRHGRGRPMSLYDADPGGARALSRGLALGDPAGAAARAGGARLALAGRAPRGRRRARPDARLLPRGRVLLRHVPPRARSAKHLVEVCTNLSCALVGAQRVVEAFEEELGVHAGETTADGEVTFRAVECLGGCGYATVVAVDHRYRQRRHARGRPGDREGARCLS